MDKGIEKKKVAAILAAVDRYCEEEKKVFEQGTPVVTITPWTTYGRLHSMNVRYLWQSRLYK